jgi:hypothetical protein
MKRVALVVAWLVVAAQIAWGAFNTPPYEPAAVQAKLPAYQVKADLSNVVNRAQFGAFTAEQRALLAKQGFFVAPAQHVQLYHVYENNDYLVIPNFISSDAVLQLYHIFYDYSLREMEGERLIALTGKLTRHLLAESLSTYRHLPDGPVREAALLNVASFGVAAKALDLKVELPAEAAKPVGAEWKMIEAHRKREQSAIFPYEIDFSQFVPRGHYTRGERLKRYFKAMMWYGLVPYALEWPEGDRPPTIDYPQIRQSLLITRLLYETALDGKPAIATWDRIYEPTAFYVELSDDLTPMEWREAALKVWGHLPNPAELADEGKLTAFHDLAMQMRQPKIATFPDHPGGIDGMATGPQFRVMGQRVIPDSYMLQQLVSPNVGGEERQRVMPMGLDVFSALGSARAAGHLQAMGETEYAHYEERMANLRSEFAAKTEADWRGNLYWGWLWTLKALAERAGAGYPSFMQTEAWQDKQLTTVLASWAELRHDTILYAKQSASSECGGEEPGEQPPVPKGYVEPAAEAYHRLLWLTRATRQGLRERDLLSPALDESFGRMEDLLVFLERVSLKELAGEPLKAAEYDQIRLLGAELESLTNAVSVAIGGAAGGLVSETDEDMAVIADVHSATFECLEEGVGHGNEIYVVVPIEGKLCLTRGAVFSYYEFGHPVSDRLTDEAWQAMLTKGTGPAPPAWTASFLTKPKSEIPAPKLPRTAGHGGC